MEDSLAGGRRPVPSQPLLVRELLAKVQAILAVRDRHTEFLEQLEAHLLLWLDLNDVPHLLDGPVPPDQPPIHLFARGLLISRAADGSAMVQIDGGKPFRLAPRLTDLLAFLSADDLKSEDSLVHWKSRASARAWLEKISGKKVRPHYINKLVHDLKRRFREAGIDTRFIQTHASKGLRFALKRRPTKRWAVVSGSNGR